MIYIVYRHDGKRFAPYRRTSTMSRALFHFYECLARAGTKAVRLAAREGSQKQRVVMERKHG
jgi:hypothetical protein